MHRALVLTGPLLFAACAPQNASLTGDFTAFLADSSAITLQRGRLKPKQFETNYAVDCRTFASARDEEEQEQLRLNGRIPVCRGDERDDGSVVQRAEWPPVHESWMGDDGFVVVGDQFAPWRGEAIITSEGDVQIGFHQRLPGGDDFRFAIAVDPDFQPRQCVQSDSGDGVVYEEIHGNWLEEWSAGVDGQMFFLNASAYQFNPSDLPSPNNRTAREWVLPNEWMAGFARGRFADDDFRARPPRYAEPAAYLRYDASQANSDNDATVSIRDLFHCPWFGEDFDPDLSIYDECMGTEATRAEGIATEIAAEYENVQISADAAGVPSFTPVVHNNAWRAPDTFSAGLDRWVELHYSWIRFDSGSELRTGGAATGEFSIVFDAFDSPSRFLVRGTFEVKRFKRDTWTMEYLPPVKFDEYESTLCGTEVLPPDNF